ncbi:MAG: hypothetical protein MJ050_07320, partial [Phascolarctobacterium sp.]|nr:hypothetical protein [Phascolarctobacterium sp.]
KNATLSGNVEATVGRITIEAQSINTKGIVKAGNHILMDATNGGLDINNSIQNVQNGIELYAKNGQVNINNDVTAGEDGLLRIYAELEDQKLSEELVNAVLVNGELTSINGSVDVGAVNGDIDIHNITAEEQMAAVGTKNGNVVIGDISAGTVVLYNHDANNSVQANNVTVSKALVVQSAKPVIEHVDAAPGAKNIIIDITGSGSEVDPEGKITIGSKDENVDWKIANLAVGVAKVYTAGNIDIGNLYVNGNATSEVIAKQRVAIDSLTVKDKVYASGYDYDASIYGTKPEHDDSKAIYFDDKVGSAAISEYSIDFDNLFFGKDAKTQAIKDVINEIKKSKPDVILGTDKGMNLYISDSHNQTSNGKLLHLDNYYYVHNQRYSAEDLSRILADYKAMHTYALYYGDNLGLFKRNNLYELPSNEIVNGQLKNTMVSFILTDAKEEKKNS